MPPAASNRQAVFFLSDACPSSSLWGVERLAGRGGNTVELPEGASVAGSAGMRLTARVAGRERGAARHCGQRECGVRDRWTGAARWRRGGVVAAGLRGGRDCAFGECFGQERGRTDSCCADPGAYRCGEAGWPRPSEAKTARWWSSTALCAINTRGRETLYLDYEAYEEMALKQMRGAGGAGAGASSACGR